MRTVVVPGKRHGPAAPPEVFNKARKAAPGYDVQGLHRDWIGFWRDTGSPVLQSPEKAFLGFCRERHKRTPLR
jgi:hypothetical protein